MNAINFKSGPKHASLPSKKKSKIEAAEKFISNIFSIFLKLFTLLIVILITHHLIYPDTNQNYQIKVTIENQDPNGDSDSEEYLARDISHNLNKLNTEFYRAHHEINNSSFTHEEPANFSVELPVTGIVVNNLQKRIKNIQCHISIIDSLTKKVTIHFPQIKKEFIVSNCPFPHIECLEMISLKSMEAIEQELNPIALANYYIDKKRYVESKKIGEKLTLSDDIQIKKWGFNLIGTTIQNEQHIVIKTIDINEYTKAIQNYKKALELDPNFTTSYINLAVIEIRCKKYDKAIKHLEHALKLNPRNYRTLNNLSYVRGLLWYRSQSSVQRDVNFKKAISEARKAVEIAEAEDANSSSIAHYKANLAELLYMHKGKITPEIINLFNASFYNGFNVRLALRKTPYKELSNEQEFLNLLTKHYGDEIIQN